MTGLVNMNNKDFGLVKRKHVVRKVTEAEKKRVFFYTNNSFSGCGPAGFSHLS